MGSLTSKRKLGDSTYRLCPFAVLHSSNRGEVVAPFLLIALRGYQEGLGMYHRHS